jgi:hypothetical protein
MYIINIIVKIRKFRYMLFVVYNFDEISIFKGQYSLVCSQSNGTWNCKPMFWCPPQPYIALARTTAQY